MSCNGGTFAVGAFADAPPAIARDTPAAPNAGKPLRPRFRLEGCFVRAIVKPPVRVRRMLLGSALTSQTPGHRLRQAMQLSNKK